MFEQEGPVVVVVDSSNHRLCLWRLRDGTAWKTLGSPGTEPQFNWPHSVAVTRAGALVVTDSIDDRNWKGPGITGPAARKAGDRGSSRVQVLTVEGAVLCVLDTTSVAGVGRLGYQLPGVTVCMDTGDILVTDWECQRVVALTWLPSYKVSLT